MKKYALPIIAVSVYVALVAVSFLFKPADIKPVEQNVPIVSEQNIGDASNATELYETSLYDDPSLVAYYRLDDTTDSKNDYDLYNTGSATFTSGVFNNAADFGEWNGFTASKTLERDASFLTDSKVFTYSIWVKLNREMDETNPDPIYNHEWTFLSDYRIHPVSPDYWPRYISYDLASGTPRVYFQWQVSGVSKTGVRVDMALGTTTWHNLVMTGDGTTLRGYVDGGLEGSNPIPDQDSTTIWDINKFSIGALSFTNDYRSFTDSIIDDVAIFSRALSDEEVASIYEEGTSTPAGFTPGQRERKPIYFKSNIQFRP